MPNEIRTFFTHMLSICLLGAIMVGLVFFSIQPDPGSYFAGSFLQANLLKNIEGPRIIVVGGSNVAFGIDAELMQKELGIPVINDGLHASLGVAPLRELLEYIHKGDVIIVSFEYQIFTEKDAMDGDSAFLSDWIEQSPSRIFYLSNPLTDAPFLYGMMLQRKANRSLDTALHGGTLDGTRNFYNGRNFDANGDFIGHLKASGKYKIHSNPYPVSPVRNEILIFLENFNKMAQAKGASVYLEAPASREMNCRATGNLNMTSFFKKLKAKTTIPVLTELETLCMPNPYFFDTEYHLTAEGRKFRTIRLIENLVQVDAGLSNR